MNESGNILAIINNTPDAVIKDVAARVKARRLEKNLTQREMAKRSGMGYESYRRFETSGEISFSNLVRCAFTLNAADGFSDLFSQPAYQSIDDLLNSKTKKQRKRGRSNG